MDFLKKLFKKNEEEDLSILEELKGEHDLNLDNNQTSKQDLSLSFDNKEPDLNSNKTNLNNNEIHINDPLNNYVPELDTHLSHNLNDNNLLTFANNQNNSDLNHLNNLVSMQQKMTPQNSLIRQNSEEVELDKILTKLELIESKIEKIESKLELIYNMLAYR